MFLWVLGFISVSTLFQTAEWQGSVWSVEVGLGRAGFGMDLVKDGRSIGSIPVLHDDSLCG